MNRVRIDRKTGSWIDLSDVIALGIRDDDLLRCYPWREAFLDLNRERLPTA